MKHVYGYRSWYQYILPHYLSTNLTHSDRHHEDKTSLRRVGRGGKCLNVSKIMISEKVKVKEMVELNSKRNKKQDLEIITD